MTTALIVSADEQRAWQIREALSAADVEIGQIFATSHALLHRLAQPREGSIDLLVIDENSTPMNQWDLIRELGVRQPTSAILAVVTDPQPEDYTAALSNGARGVVRFPLSYEEIASLVESAVGWSTVLRDVVSTHTDSSLDRGGRILVTAGAKGGTGTTTLALHLALQAAEHRPNDRIVFVDLDLQKPDASILLDVPRSRQLIDLLGVIEELTPRHLDDVLFRHPSGLQILFGPERGEEGELVTEFAARQILSMLAARTDLVIIDIGSVIGEAGATALEMADTILSVSTLDVLSLRGVHRQTELWDRLNVQTGGTVRIVLNKVTKNSSLGPSAAKRILNYPLLSAVVHDDTRGLESAVNQRDPELTSPSWKQDIDGILHELGIIAPPSIQDKRQRQRFGGRADKKKAGHSDEAVPEPVRNSGHAVQAQADNNQFPPRPNHPPEVGSQPTGAFQRAEAPRLRSLPSTDAETSAQHSAPRREAEAPKVRSLQGKATLHSASVSRASEAPLLRSLASRDAKAPTLHPTASRDAEAPILHSAPSKQAETPTPHTPPNRDAEAPTVHTPPSREAEAPTLHTPPNRDAEAPTVHTPPSRDVEAPTAHTPSDSGSQAAALQAMLNSSSAEPELKRPRPRSRYRRAARSDAERGAVSIEALAITGLFGLFTAIAFQMVLVGLTFVFASHAADEGARAAAVGANPTTAAVSATPDGWADDMTVSTSGGRVTVRMATPTLVPKSVDFALEIPASAGIVKEPS